LQFLYPIGFLALASLVFPILIHLWQVKSGKTLKIGSISLLGENAASNARSWHLNDLLLLFLRCLVLTLLAFLLAKPYLRDKYQQTKQAGWILLSQDELKQVYDTQKQTIDSLLAKGYEIHHLGYGFKRLHLRDTAEIITNTSNNKKLNYSSLLKQLNDQLQPKFNLWIFAPKYAHQFDEVLPATHLEINWKEIAPLEGLNNYYVELLNKKYQAKNTESIIAYATVSEQHTRTLNVVIKPAHTEDARYVKAALQAISHYLNQPFTFNNDINNNQSVDLLFWLDENSIPRQIHQKVKTNGLIFRYADGKIDHNPTYLASQNSFEPITLKRKISSTNTKEEIIWRGGDGRAILSKETQKQPLSYKFYSELNPKHTDLIWHESFVSMLMALVFGEGKTNFGFVNHANEKLTNTAPVASFNKQKQSKPKTIAATKNLDHLVWLLLVMVLLAERILTFKTKPSHS
jgi:hypothetical protein